MRYLLDTSACVDVLRARRPVLQRLAAISPDATTVSAMTVAELRYGLLRAGASAEAATRLGRFLALIEVLPFDAIAAEHHAQVRHALAIAGTPIGERDLVIASTALAHELVVATGNVSEFRRVPALRVEEWA
jgi:tRNA(fMet)-specific endonuclease VapC